jgi:putative transposase
MREYERFCGVRVLTYCIMSNHFPILLEVPERPQAGLRDEELVVRLKGLSVSVLLTPSRLAVPHGLD